MEKKRLRAANVAALLAHEILDLDDAASFLGIKRNSLEYAAYRHRVPFVHYGAKKFFALADLEDYRDLRGRGRDSQLSETEPIQI